MNKGIRIDQVSKNFDNGRIQALKDVSLEIDEGEIFGFLGPNGGVRPQ